MTDVVRLRELVEESPPLEPDQALERLGELAGALRAGLDDLGPARLQYVSPEEILGRASGRPSEVYSLTAALCRYLTGTVPFPQGYGRAVLFWHLHAPRPRPTAVRPALPAAIDAVVARGMAVDPAVRTPTAGELIEQARLALQAGPPRTEPVVAHHPSRVARRSRGHLLRAGLVAALAVAAGAAAFVAVGAVDDSPGFSNVSAGRLQLTAPSDWRPAERIARPALPLTDPLVLAPSDSAGSMLLAGVATPSETVATLSRLEASPPHGELVALARTQARRYRAEPPGVTGGMTLYLAPMDGGVATVACVAEAASFLRSCEGAAASLALVEGRFTPVAQTSRQRTGQTGAFRRLNRARARYRSRVTQARTAAASAAAAGELASANGRAAVALRSLGLTGIARPGARGAVRALERGEAAFRSLATAAGDGDRRRYAATRRSALAADGALRRALEMLRLVGYGM